MGGSAFIVQCSLGFQLSACAVDIKYGIGSSINAVGQGIPAVGVCCCYSCANAFACCCVFCNRTRVGGCGECRCLVHISDGDGDINGGSGDAIGDFNRDFIGRLRFKI